VAALKKGKELPVGEASCLIQDLFTQSFKKNAASLSRQTIVEPRKRGEHGGIVKNHILSLPLPALCGPVVIHYDEEREVLF